MAIYKRLKLSILTSAIIASNMLAPTYAQGVSSCSDTLTCMQAITQNTYESLQAINNIPTYFTSLRLGEYISSWLTPDNSDSTAQMQANFTALGIAITQALNAQNTDQLQLLSESFGNDVTRNDFTATSPSQPAAILNKVPNINDIAYSTLFGRPPVPNAPNAASAPYNYIKNAAGVTIPHFIPSPTWEGKQVDKNKYNAYFNSVMSIESFNAYVLSNQYANAQSFNDTQVALINQVNGGDGGASWLAQVSTEELGKVIRQLLVFQSQSYVLLSQLIQTQRQLLAAQTMTNTLLILNNTQDEAMLVAKAQGVRPSV